MTDILSREIRHNSSPCPKCKALNEVDSDFCDQCGEELLPQKSGGDQLTSVSVPIEPSVLRFRIPTEKIKEELQKLYSGKKNTFNNILLLLISVGLFISLGLSKNSISGILMITGVIFIHELGHYWGMKYFNYHNVHMVFLPMLGAATSGMDSNPSGARKAIVLLLGPLPGLCIGYILLKAYACFPIEFLRQTATTFLVLNVFNLLPISPMDGGRFFEEILFSRSVVAEFLSKLLFILVLGFMATSFHSIVLGVLTFIMIISLYWVMIWAGIAKDMRKDVRAEDIERGGIVPDQYLEIMRAKLDPRFEHKLITAKSYAKHVQITWQRICNRPPSFAITFGLILLYGFFITFGAVVPLKALKALIAEERAKLEYKIEVFAKSDGSQARREAIYRKGKLISWSEIDDRGLYNGSSETYSPVTGKLENQGEWFLGKRHGTWKFFDRNGNHIRSVTFLKGRYIFEDDLKNGQWVTKHWNDLSGYEKKLYELGLRKSPVVAHLISSKKQTN